VLVDRPVSRRKADRLFRVVCARCGQARLLSDGRARAIAREGPSVCRSCRQRPPKIRDQDRLWWLRRYDDETIAQLAATAFGRGDPRAVSSWRLRLSAGDSS
jgi:hypothetical protein